MSATTTPEPTTSGQSTTTTASPAASPAVTDRTFAINDYGRIAISLVVVVAFLAIAVLVLRSAVDKDVGNNLIVQFGTLATLVVGYWVGSSAGSTEKNRTGSSSTTTTTGTTP